MIDLSKKKKVHRNCPCCGESIIPGAPRCSHCGALIKKKPVKKVVAPPPEIYDEVIEKKMPSASPDMTDKKNKIFRDFVKGASDYYQQRKQKLEEGQGG